MLLNRPAAFRENETEIREAWKLLMKRDNFYLPTKILRLLQENAIPILCMILLSPIRESAVEEYSRSPRVCTNQLI